jgi:H+/gluconate symporter-like permease
MDMSMGILMLVLYAVVVVLIMKGESPIIMLLVLTLVWAVLAGVPIMGEAGKDILSGVLEKGGTAYASAVVIIVFGAWFGQVLVKTHIAENIV